MDLMEQHLRRDGETLTLESGAALKASLTASTKATYSLGNRAYYFQGSSTRGGAVGDYLIRESDGLPYFIETIQPDPMFPKTQVVFLVQCNVLATLSRPETKADGDGNLVSFFQPYAEGVRAFKDTTTRSMKPQNDGLLDQARYALHLPHRYGVRVMDRVSIRCGERAAHYRVDSISDTLTPIDSASEGVDVLQLTLDNRSNGEG